MTDSDSLRGDDRPDPNLPSCCGELEILRALLRPRMTEAGDPTPTAALRGMFIEIERLRSATGDGLLNCDGQTPTRRDIILLPLTKADLEANRGALTNLREQLKGLLDIPLMGPDIDSNICKRIESIKSDLEDARLASQSLAACRHTLETIRGRLHEALGLAMDSNGDKAIFARIESIRRNALMERQLAIASAEGHDHARSLLVEIAEVFGHVDDHRALPKMVKELDDARDCYWLEFGDAPPVVVNAIKADALKRADLPMRARCPVCHRMAMVKDGCFQAHTSGDKACAGSANSAIQRDALHAWREWLLAKDMTLHADMYDSQLRASFDVHAAESRRLNDKRIDGLQAELGVHAATIEAYELALHTLGWRDEPKAEEWAKTTAAHYKAVREALGVPADKPIIPYAQHAAKGMQALAILGWHDTHPVEWATKRAAADADLRGAFAEAELVGSDHAAMVRQMLGHRRIQSSRLVDALARIHQLEFDYSKVHLEGRVELAEKRIKVFRDWVIGMTPAGTSTELSDDELIRTVQFVPRADFDAQTIWTDSLAKECAHLRSLIEVMADIKRRLNALPSLST